MEINICVWNWKDYNEGLDTWEWFDLPREASDLEGYLSKLSAEGKDEPFICDTDGHTFIGEMTSINQVIELSYSYDDEMDLLDHYLSSEAYDELPLSMDELDAVLDGYKSSEILRMQFYGDFNIRDDFFEIDGNGNLKSYSQKEYNELVNDRLDEAAAAFLRGEL